jgi:predicted Zn finger-like uncharacterized protein
MIIQCPSCKSRYRSRVLSPGQSPLQINCPKCNHRFLVNPPQPQTTESSEPEQARRVLMVDDARFFRELMLDLLSDIGVKLLTANNAEDAWELLGRQGVELLIVDINLPDKNGLELIREIRRDARFKGLRILCISGVYRRDDDAMAAIRAGADDFISKSFKPEELLARVEKLLKS